MPNTFSHIAQLFLSQHRACTHARTCCAKYKCQTHFHIELSCVFLSTVPIQICKYSWHAWSKKSSVISFPTLLTHQYLQKHACNHTRCYNIHAKRLFTQSEVACCSAPSALSHTVVLFLFPFSSHTYKEWKMYVQPYCIYEYTFEQDFVASMLTCAPAWTLCARMNITRICVHIQTQQY